MRIKWAPLRVPMHRRLEIFCAWFVSTLAIFSSFISAAICVWLSVYSGIYGKIIFGIYLIFFVIDRNSHVNCDRGQGKDYMRSSVFMWLWRGCANYFPLELVKTAELPPTTNYVFGFFPHAYAWSFGSYGHFVAQATNFRQLFPGVRSKSALAPFNFFIPFLRDTLLAGGAMSNSAESVKFALMRSNDPKEIYNRDGFTSNAVVLTVGGMREAFFAQPGVNRVNLRNRKGFIKIAIRAGVPVVPIYSFNEIEVYNFIRLDHSSKLYQFIQNLLGFVPPLGLNGRGFFQYTFGTIPRRHRIVTVIGASIQTVKNDSPSIEEINEVHQKFMDAMYQLFEAHKHKYLENPDQAVLIME